MTSALTGYRVLETLHASPRSLVERVVRLADGETVVIKRAAEPCVASEALRRAQQEYDLLRAVRGDGVVAVHRVGRAHGRVVLELEAFGESLNAVLARSRLDLATALDVAIDVARSLDRIHAAGI